MTLRTTSATRRTVVSRSSDVASTSATSSSNDSTGNRSGLDSTEPISLYDSSRVPVVAGSNHGPKRGFYFQGATIPSALSSWYHANVGEVAILLRVIKPEANHEFVGNLESDVIAFQRQLAPRRLVEQCRNFQRPRLTRHQHFFQVRHGQARIENVLDQDDVLVLNGLINIFGQLHFARRVPAAF